jgi:hypothetical protein
MDDKDFVRFVELAEQELVARGQIIEAGFSGFKLIFEQNWSPETERLSRIAFYAGAQHLYVTLMRIMDQGIEPTEADMARMARVHDELARFEETILQPAAKKYRERRN